MLRRPSTHILFLLLLAPILPGCRDKRETELTFRTLASAGSQEFIVLQKIVDAFNRQNPNTKVRLLADRVQRDYQMRRIVARHSAEIIDIRGGEFSFLVDRGALSPLTSDCESLESQIHPMAWDPAVLKNQETGKDELYAVPWAACPKLLLYNKNAFREAHLDPSQPPRTWDDLLNAADTLTQPSANGAKHYGFALPAAPSEDLGRFFALLLFQRGQPLTRLVDNHARLNLAHVEATRTMTQILALQKAAPPECVVSDEAAALRQFLDGRAAMVIAGPQALAPAAGQINSSDIGVAPVPGTTTSPAVNQVTFRYLAIPAFVQGPRRDAAAKFLHFIAARQAQQILAEGNSGSHPLLSVRSDLLDTWYPRQDSRLNLFAAAIGHPLPTFDVMLWESSSDWLKEIHSLLLHNNRPVGAVMQIAQERGDQAISCIVTDIGHPSATVTVGMVFVAVLLFISVATAASRY